MKQDLEQIEDWNEYGELKENVADAKPTAKATPSASAAQTPSKPPPAPAAPAASSPSPAPKALVDETKIRPLEPDTVTAEPPKQDPQASLAAAMRNIGFEAAKQAGDKKAQSRKDVLEAAKTKDGELKKLDNSAAAGLPPPTGTTEAEEAQKPETGETSTTSKADEIPAITVDEPKADEAEETAGEKAKGKSREEVLDDAEDASKDNVPSSTEVQKKANEAIADNEEEVLEGLGQADPEKVEIPTAKEIEALANEAIVEDKRSHVQIKGGGTVPLPLSPPMKRQKKPDNVPDPDLGEDEKKADATVSEVEDENALSKTADRQEAKVGVAPPVEAAASNAEELKDTSEQKEASEQETPRQNEGPEGVIPLTNTDQDDSNASTSATSTTKPAASANEGVLPLTDGPTEDAAPADKDSPEASTSSKKPEILDSKDDQVASKPSAAAAVTEASQNLPGSKTQDQPAAAGDKVGESVGD